MYPVNSLDLTSRPIDLLSLGVMSKCYSDFAELADSCRNDMCSGLSICLVQATGPVDVHGLYVCPVCVTIGLQ